MKGELSYGRGWNAPDPKFLEHYKAIVLGGVGDAIDIDALKILKINQTHVDLILHRRSAFPLYFVTKIDSSSVRLDHVEFDLFSGSLETVLESLIWYKISVSRCFCKET